MKRHEILAVVPARGGSIGLRRKNLLPGPDGRPLFLISADASTEAGCRTFISTDDPEIRSIARAGGHRVHWRGPELADVPVDRVVSAVVAKEQWKGPVLLVQPTVQPMNADILNDFLDSVFLDSVGWLTPATLGVEDRHLMWLDGYCRMPRIERQQDAAWPVREMGVRWWPTPDITEPTRVITLAERLVDIDTVDDYATMRPRRRIQFTTIASQRYGWGHLRRVLTLAERLQHHHVAIRLIGDYDTAAQALLAPWPEKVPDPHVHVHDSLDMGDREPVRSIALETHRDDAAVTINALYGHGDYSGRRFAVVRDEFWIARERYQHRSRARSVMIMFGGTDPGGLTEKAEAAAQEWDMEIIRPYQSASVAAAMLRADLLLTSGGRTLFEAATVGLPALAIAQNPRELTHTHLGVGNLSMGLGVTVTPGHLRDMIAAVMANPDLRLDMSMEGQASMDRHGATRICAIIEQIAEFGGIIR